MAESVITWKYVAVTTIGMLIGGAPSHFSDLRPTRDEVSTMIQKEAPLTFANDLKEIKQVQNEIKIEQAKLSVTLESVLYELKREKLKRDELKREKL